MCHAGRVRSSLVLAILTGCGFSAPSGVGSPVADGPATTGDGPPVVVDGATDAGTDAAIDAPPCPDGDSDGVCDALDLWPCGPQPQPPGDPVTSDSISGGNHLAMTLTGTTLGSGKLRAVAPGATFTVTASYSILDCICTGCIDQIQVGLVPGTTKKCIYDANPSCSPASTGAGNVTLTAPSTPGVYDVRFRVGQDYSCTGNSGNNIGWWTNVAPDATTTVAKICVH